MFYRRRKLHLIIMISVSGIIRLKSLRDLSTNIVLVLIIIIIVCRTYQVHIPSDLMLMALTIITPAMPCYHKDAHGKQGKK